MTSPADQDPGLDLKLERVLNAPRELIFSLWSQPEHLRRWWGPADCALAHAEFDFRIGGRYRCCLQYPERNYWMRGVYRDIREAERIVFTHGWENDDGEVEIDTLITVELFVLEQDRTRLVFHQRGFASPASRDSHIEGWDSCLDRLADHLSGSLARDSGKHADSH